MNLWQAFKMAFKSISMKKTRSFQIGRAHV